MRKLTVTAVSIAMLALFGACEAKDKQKENEPGASNGPAAPEAAAEQVIEEPGAPEEDKAGSDEAETSAQAAPLANKVLTGADYPGVYNEAGEYRSAECNDYELAIAEETGRLLFTSPDRPEDEIMAQVATETGLSVRNVTHIYMKAATQCGWVPNY